MNDKLFDFHVQMKIHELHDLKSADLAEMIRIGLAVLQSDWSAKPRIMLTSGVNKIETAGRGWDVWENPEFRSYKGRLNDK